jgi:hypothetical protein
LAGTRAGRLKPQRWRGTPLLRVSPALAPRRPHPTLPQPSSGAVEPTRLPSRADARKTRRSGLQGAAVSGVESCAGRGSGDPGFAERPVLGPGRPGAAARSAAFRLG